MAAAAAGDPDGARAAISVVSGVEPVRRSAHYLRGANGMILSLDTVTPVIQQQIAKGETPVLSEQEIRNYLSTGSIDG